ncbi:MAG TPA: YegP family protein [Isosphaeraceae bacterium]|nr:YegP family protein [Isosphaeraceae bacterium]
MAGTFELKGTESNEYVFNLKAANGEVILTSQRYKAKSGAAEGIESVRVNAAHDERFDRRTSTAGEPYFVLKAANGQVIGTSEMYSATAAMEKGIASVRANASEAKVHDTTGAAGSG